MMAGPQEDMVTLAIEAATRSPCAKSKRGVVVYGPLNTFGVSDDERYFIGDGFNGMPNGYSCDGSDACRSMCSKRCLHAEDRAIRNALGEESRGHLHGCEAVHVKVVGGKLAWGGGPSCWQCSRTVLDVGLEAFWLYERVHKTCTCPHADYGESGTDCFYCDGVWCAVHSELAESSCSCSPVDRHTGLPPVQAHWVRYTADEFHRVTLEANGLIDPA